MADKVFQVIVVALNVRSAPGLDSRYILPNVQLRSGQKVIVDANSRTEKDGIIWWRHSAGWSAERRVDNRTIYMTPVNVTPPPPPPPPPNTTTFYVVEPILNIRASASTAAPVTGVLYLGQQITAETNSRTVVGGNVFWKHSRGWSAERNTITNQVYMTTVKPGVPGIGFGFERLPLGFEYINKVFYFGNTQFAWDYGAQNNYNGYSQGLHGGLDLEHTGGAPVVAGVRGIFDGPGSAFPPNRVDVLVGKYRIIYGHLAKPNRTLQRGATVMPTTQLGEIDFKEQHVHIEIRMGIYILNPLLFMSDALVNQLVTRFPPAGDTRFYSSPTFKQWQTPLDQPVIRLAGPIIGPKAF
jgi:hypothetical protein